MAKLVLTIDDDKVIHHLVEEALNDVAQVIHAKEGEQGLHQAQKHNPDIILLDVEMPGMDGYLVCKALKVNPQTRHIPVLFLSGRGDLQERIKGYQAGADDYIIKPFQSEELKARIEVLYQYRHRSQQLEKQVGQAQTTAELAMSDSTDMGRVMRYVSQSYGAHDLATLSRYFFAFFEPMELDVVVAFWYESGAHFFSSKGAQCPLEQELLTRYRDANRFEDFDSTTIINYPKVSLLVKNMPVQDPALYGRYKDLLPHLLEATHAKVNDMENGEKALMQVDELSTTLGQFERHISELLTQNDPNALVACMSQYMAQLNGLHTQLQHSLAQLTQSSSPDEQSSQTDIELF